ncbi:MAG: aminopeptidase, partial [Clostridia bacterium]|nr:aminopeptidase [Clostridia bacterium]
MEHISAWKKYDAATLEAVEALCKDYRAFLDAGKTERECVKACEAAAKAAGFKKLVPGETKVKPGDKVYMIQMQKAIVLFVVGTEPLEKGMRILGAHIDSPRIDVKPNPLYESDDIAYLDTQYYGGIKKYQWLAMPLAIHGVVAKKDGTVVDVCIGEKDDDPVFAISDLLPHLAQEQMKADARSFIDGENMDLIIANCPLTDEEKEPVKARALKLLAEYYGMEEKDFLSAELEIVPAGKCREMGFDRSMLLGYGHDDRVCAFPSMRAVLDYEGVPAQTLCCVLTDKEEIGSVGATGMSADYFENIVAELVDAASDNYSELTLRRMLKNSSMLSSDVSAAYDPAYASAFEKRGAAFMGAGVCFNKYTGGRGKSESSDANAEYVGEVRRIMEDADVAYQLAELGKVDLGGGGTIAFMCARYGMDVIDSGVPVLSMHAPYEIV